MTRKYFGTDGIRGTVGQAPITPDFVLRLGHAVGRVLKRSHDQAPGADRQGHPHLRLHAGSRAGSGPELRRGQRGAAGASAHPGRGLPDPGAAGQLGVVISASHNPYPDNGIKFFSAQGNKLPDDWEQPVEAAMQEAPQWVNAAELGKAQRLDDAAGRYIEFCKSTFANDLSLHGLKIVVDAAHGAAYHIAPKVFHELGAEVLAIGCQPNGLNINHQVGATHPDALARAVRANHADYGVALDGDADRLLMVDAQGRIFNGDELLYLMVQDRLQQGQRVPGAVGTLMTNMAVELALRQQGVEFVRAKVGDRYVLEQLHAKGWQLGGEGSGHLLALDKHSTGDGLISALQVLQACVRSGKTLVQLLQGLQLFPQELINVRLHPEQDWQNSPALQTVQAQARQALADRGRVLIRASGTEPLLRIMVEAQDAAQARHWAQQLADSLRT